MPFNVRAPTTEYVSAVNRAPFSLSEPNDRRRPIAGPLSTLSAAMYTLIVTAKLNDVDPQAWLGDVLARIAELPHTRVHELLPWHWKAVRHQTLAA